MTTAVPVTRSRDRGITTLTLDSPANRNALSAGLVAALDTALTECGADPGVRAVVLTHTGTTFSAGADLREPPPPEALTALLRRIVELPRPVIARVTGHVRAGGLGLLGACDIAAAATTADFAFTEVRVGVAPAVVSLPLLPRADPAPSPCTASPGTASTPPRPSAPDCSPSPARTSTPSSPPSSTDCAAPPRKGSRRPSGSSPPAYGRPSTGTPRP